MYIHATGVGIFYTIVILLYMLRCRAKKPPDEAGEEKRDCECRRRRNLKFALRSDADWLSNPCRSSGRLLCLATENCCSRSRWSWNVERCRPPPERTLSPGLNY